MSDKISENQVETYLKEQVKSIGFLSSKFKSPGKNGVPDQIITQPFGTLYVECKAPGKKPRKNQLSDMRTRIKAGAVCLVVDNYEKTDHLVNFLNLMKEDSELSLTDIDSRAGRYYGEKETKADLQQNEPVKSNQATSQNTSPNITTSENKPSKYPKLLTGVPSPPNINLRDYQEYARDFVLTRPKSGLFLDMGVGKTLISLCALYALNPNHPVLIIAPPNIAKASWSGEIEKWNLPFEYQSLIINKNGNNLSKKRRHKLYSEVIKNPPKLYILSNSSTSDIVSWFFENKIEWPFKTVIIDESQSFKSYNAKKFESLRSVSPFIERTILLSGTPAPNGPMDLWSQINLLDNGARLGVNITAYRNTYFYVSATNDHGIPIKYTPRVGAESYIYNSIRDLVISIKNADIELPKLIINDIVVSMSKQQIALYNELKQEYVIDVYDNTGNSVEIEAANAAVLTGKLLQLASGNIYDEDKNAINVHDEKANILVDIINNTDSPVLVLYAYDSDLHAMTRVLKEAGHSYTHFNSKQNVVKLVEDWNAGKIPILIAHPASAGHGLNLQDGPGHTMVWYTLPYNLEHYMQANKRLHRSGQKNNVVMHRLLTDGTIDKRLTTVLQAKEDTQKRLLDTVNPEVIDDVMYDDENQTYSVSPIDLDALLYDEINNVDLV